MDQKLDFLKQLAHGLAVQFGNSCEVVIHDLTKKDLDKSIVYIENGHISNRNPSASAASSSMTGPSMRQGPHQDAQKSTRTGMGEERTS